MKSKMTAKDYSEKVKKASPNSNILKNMLFAFLIGGAICTIGQFLINLYKFAGISEKISSTIASVTLIFLSAVLTCFGIYDKIAKIGGAGTLVPITGFANAVVSPALEFKSEGYVLGLGAKMFIIAGPVIVYGTLASVLYGLIIFVFSLY